MKRDERRQARILALQVFFCFEQKKFKGSIKNIFDDVVSFDEINEGGNQNDENLLGGNNGIIDEILNTITADSPSDLGEKVKNYALKILEFTAKNLTEIDKKIEDRTKNWGAFERINPIDRNLMRIAIAEMDEQFSVPPKVVMNEAIEIAKFFGTDDSTKFVNAVLDKIVKEYCD